MGEIKSKWAEITKKEEVNVEFGDTNSELVVINT